MSKVFLVSAIFKKLKKHFPHLIFIYYALFLSGIFALILHLNDFVYYLDIPLGMSLIFVGTFSLKRFYEGIIEDSHDKMQAGLKMFMMSFIYGALFMMYHGFFKI
jgi:hypothetical protein